MGLNILILAISCSEKKTNKLDIMDKIVELSEFKKSEARIDSLKRIGIKVELQIAIVKDSFYPEDSLKNISLALIEEDYGFDQNILYEVKFNKTTQEIISVESSKIK